MPFMVNHITNRQKTAVKSNLAVLRLFITFCRFMPVMLVDNIVEKYVDNIVDNLSPPFSTVYISMSL